MRKLQLNGQKEAKIIGSGGIWSTAGSIFSEVKRTTQQVVGLVCRIMEGSLRREYDGRRQSSPSLPIRPDHYAGNLSGAHDLGPYSHAPTPQSDTSSASRFGSFVDRGASSSSSHRAHSVQPRHSYSRSAMPLVQPHIIDIPPPDKCSQGRNLMRIHASFVVAAPVEICMKSAFPLISSGV